jgi:virulence factor Mce-like protein
MATLNRTRRPKRRRDEPLARSVVLGGLVIGLIFLGCIYLALRLYNGVPTTNYVKTYVSVPNVGNLLTHDAVRIGGKRVGQVYSIDLGDDGRPRVRLQLDPGTRLPQDTRVTIRANGLLGARYVQLVPGTSQEFLGNGSTIRGGPESFTSGLPEAIDTFDEGSRRNLQKVIDELSVGLFANGERINGLNRNLALGPRKFGEVASGVTSRDEAAARLIPSFESALEAIEPTKIYADRFLRNGADAAGPFGRERRALQDTLSVAPAALAAATDGLTRGRPLLASVRELSTAAAATLPAAPPALADLSTLFDEAPPVLRGLLETAQFRLPRAAKGAELVLVDGAKNLIPVVMQGARLARTPLDYIGDHSCDFINFGTVMRSMTGFGQAGVGPNGRAMAFRLEAVAPAGVEAVGIKADNPLYKRVAYEAPCTYLSEPYPQLTTDPLGINTRAAR